ncbi:MAG: MFS transporter [Gammaproteobacteria bacterium]
MFDKQKSSAEHQSLAGFYFFYFASIGALLPYWNLYLKHLDFSARQIGELSAVLLATKIFAPYIWGWVADHSGKRLSIIRLAAFIGMLIFASTLVVRGYWSLFAVLAGYSFFWNATLPQFEAATMNNLGDRKHMYSRIRLWGSVGFIFTASLLAPVVERFGIHYLPWIVLLILILTWLNTLFVNEKLPSLQEVAPSSMLKTCLQPHVFALLLACFLIQASHGPYYTFFSIYAEDNGYSRSLIGQLWSLGVLAEVVVFYFMYRWLPKFGAKILLVTAMLLTVIRWWLIAYYVEYLSILLFAQLLHAASYGLFHASAIHLIDKYFTDSIQGRGQALFASISFGLGGSLGSLVSGYTWNSIGPSYVYLLAMCVALVALVQYLWIVKPRLVG